MKRRPTIRLPWDCFRGGVGKLFVGKRVVERGRYASRFAGRPDYWAEEDGLNEGENQASGLRMGTLPPTAARYRTPGR